MDAYRQKLDCAKIDPIAWRKSKNSHTLFVNRLPWTLAAENEKVKASWYFPHNLLDSLYRAQWYIISVEACWCYHERISTVCVMVHSLLITQATKAEVIKQMCLVIHNKVNCTSINIKVLQLSSLLGLPFYNLIREKILQIFPNNHHRQ